MACRCDLLVLVSHRLDNSLVTQSLNPGRGPNYVSCLRDPSSPVNGYANGGCGKKGGEARRGTGITFLTIFASTAEKKNAHFVQKHGTTGIAVLIGRAPSRATALHSTTVSVIGTIVELHHAGWISAWAMAKHTWPWPATRPKPRLRLNHWLH